MKNAILALALTLGIASPALAADCTVTTGKDVARIAPGERIYLEKQSQGGPVPFAKKAGLLECRGPVGSRMLQTIARKSGAQIVVAESPGTWGLYNPVNNSAGKDFWGKQ
ncbi:hypothetical protein [Leptospirillum ferriphilum]|uniref:Uncharacterized protein n=1 Tax=Leptospirillum ferriphilum (strain ML-04) TaxID=1048260 RepID=J9Z8S9_LEPFM|nr:hypothetical protein [Leptospirillum ferriphilum]AFS52834.1 hypothetical protein LFML04_0598 [Leptospirillum ferriphilum ML-04]